MRRFFCFFLFLLSTAGMCNIAHAAIPLKSYMEIKDGRHVIIKTFEAPPEEDPSLLKEKPFEQDGYSYVYYETVKEEIPFIEKKEESRTVTISTGENNVQLILEQLEPDMDYEADDGFAGMLHLNFASVKTEVEGYTTETFTLKDSITIMGLGNNDPSGIPKTAVKSGVTLKLKNIDWSVQEAETIDYISVPVKYKAVAHYSGSYSKQVPTGYVSTAEYKGEVTISRIDKVVYTLTYIGTEIPESVDTSDGPQEKESSFKWLVVGILICLAIICCAITAFFIFYYNTFIYLKNADEYSQIAKRRIKWSNPVVDLSGLDISGKEVTVNVRKRIAKKLFGRHINTVADGNFSIRCLVDKQDSDFWYVVDIPGTLDRTVSEAGTRPEEQGGPSTM